MRFPKNRASVYVVRRGEEAVCGVFKEYQEAEDYAGACEQQWLEKTGHRVRFYVVISTFYG